MKQINIQFHALQEELILYFIEWSSNFNLFITAMVYRPFKLEIFDSANNDFLKAKNSIDNLMLSINEPNIQVETKNQFHDLNPDVLNVYIGKRKEDELWTSFFCYRTDNIDAIFMWDKIVKQFKKNTFCGAVAINPKSNASSCLKSHRYTMGAKKMANLGVIMKPVSGNNIIKFNDNIVLNA